MERIFLCWLPFVMLYFKAGLQNVANCKLSIKFILLQNWRYVGEREKRGILGRKISGLNFLLTIMVILRFLFSCKISNGNKSYTLWDRNWINLEGLDRQCDRILFYSFLMLGIHFGSHQQKHSNKYSNVVTPKYTSFWYNIHHYCLLKRSNMQ